MAHLARLLSPDWKIGGWAVNSHAGTEQDVILTDVNADTLAADFRVTPSDSTTYGVPAPDTNLARAVSMTRAS